MEIESGLREALQGWSDRLKIARKVPYRFRQLKFADSQACYPDVEAYSAFEGYMTEASRLQEQDPQTPPPDPGSREVSEGDFTKYLLEKGVDRVVVTGLATDFWYVHFLLLYIVKRANVLVSSQQLRIL